MRYRARVSGRLGTLLARAAGSTEVSHQAPGTTLTITNDGHLPIATLVRRLDELGVQVESVRARQANDLHDSSCRVRNGSGRGDELPAPGDDPSPEGRFAEGSNDAE